MPHNGNGLVFRNPLGFNQYKKTHKWSLWAFDGYCCNCCCYTARNTTKALAAVQSVPFLYAKNPNPLRDWYFTTMCPLLNWEFRHQTSHHPHIVQSLNVCYFPWDSCQSFEVWNNSNRPDPNLIVIPSIYWKTNTRALFCTLWLVWWFWYNKNPG